MQMKSASRIKSPLAIEVEMPLSGGISILAFPSEGKGDRLRWMRWKPYEYAAAYSIIFDLAISFLPKVCV